ncbi:MAG: apolipoprotein N-acyltransferase [Candidatus Omnitrophica bacterium]|nr:apolipoprotein N-acyltransferase [Candidatus Omnitrophota bacterium]
MTRARKSVGMIPVLAAAVKNIKSVVANKANSSITKNLRLCCLSALLLILSFPKFDLWPLIWVALVPLFLAIDGKRKITSTLYAYLTGVLFFFGVIYWFIHVTGIGMVIMVIVFGLYFALFGFFHSFFQNRNKLFSIFLIPAVWVLMEFLRAHLFSGFDWASLGHSQYKNLLFIQIADITGVFGISFLIVMVNMVIKDLWVTKKAGASLVITALFLLITLGYGVFQLNQPHSNGKTIKAAVVQANVDQNMKWNESFWPAIMKKHMDLTRQAAEEQPDVIIWPETSLPNILWEDAYLLNDLVDFIKAEQIPVILGAVVQEEFDVYYNSALLFLEDGQLAGQYNKLHLVPFGEYIPFRGVFPFLEDIIPIADFTSGRDFTVLSLKGKKISALICFEDTLSALARGFVRQGAEILVNLTNDAWFKDTKAPYLHMQSALFRTIETRRPLIRAANTGVSCFIDATGHIKDMVRNEAGKPTYVEGFAVYTMNLNNAETFYTKFGDIFTYLCFACFLLLFIIRNDKK